MNTIPFKITAPLRRAVLMSLSTLMVLGAMGQITPTLADPPHRGPGGYYQRGDYRHDERRDWNRGQSWRAHERQAYYWRRAHRGPPPPVIYAPPPVVYAPQPMSQGLTLVLPLDFR